MFTGIVTSMGSVRAIEKRGDTHIVIGVPFDASALAIGASVACAGCCLTVTAKDRDTFAVTVSAETLAHTTLGQWKVGDPVNLERPLKIGDELGGHIVTGHVDVVAKLLSATPEGESLRMQFSVAPDIIRFIAAKGSVALDGVSLTVNEVDAASFGVNIIPHTLQVTTLGRLKPGGGVNLEVDLMARYVARLVR